MRRYVLTREQFIGAPIEEVWRFFSSPHNLKSITPAALDLNIVNCPEVQEIYSGMLIDYRVKPVFFLRFNWKTRIDDVSRPCFFSDSQVSGPYRFWKHEHSFVETEKGVLMKDVVHYSIGYRFLDPVLNRWIVAKKLENIFDYRGKAIQQLFKSSA